MDKNSIIGLVLIAGLLIIYSIATSPSKEEMEAIKKRNDSLELVRQEQEQEAITKKVEEQEALANNQTITDTSNLVHDSLISTELHKQFGQFAGATKGEDEFYTIENNDIKIRLAAKSGRPYSVELKNYTTYDSLPLHLFDGEENAFDFSFYDNENRLINTANLYFKPLNNERNVIVKSDKDNITLRMSLSPDKYIDYIYTLSRDSFMVNFDVRFTGMENVMNPRSTYLTLNWNILMPHSEKGREWERDNSTAYYKFYKDEVDYISERSDETEELENKIEWLAYKHQFFSSILVADDYFDYPSKVSTRKLEDDVDHIKELKSELTVPFENRPGETLNFSFYFGPNHYNTLQAYNQNFEELVPLGWGIFGWVNKILVIPIFNFLDDFISSYGIIILLLTIIIKTILFPLTFKSYQSSAKMRVLKPQIDEITKKIPKEKTMERQQATMALYKKVGVNPMGGCLPMLLQFPILIAMFRFFPASIELRQKSFLWAEDLSTYDAIFTWDAQIPLLSSIYGNHISLFTLLMAGSIVLTTVINQNQMSGAGQQMPGMKTMMYLMPVMMLFFFNKYAAGLSYYYFVANMITYIQTLTIRKFIDDKKVLAKLESNKAKPQKKKSAFQKRMEEMAKQKGYKLPKK